ncbi:MAG: 7-cyano-7-deazaguanine synthase QueC [Candidatus Cloacimonadota bacterium]
MSGAIVLLSGGMDSLVTAAIAATESDSLNFLHVDYGQRTMQKEADCFTKLCDFYQPKRHLTLKMMWLSEIGGSSLTDPTLQIKDHSGSSEIPNTYVPFRNANLIAAAVSWAEVIGAERIYIGAVEEDSSGYPDCSESFFRALQETIDLGTAGKQRIEIRTPVIHLSKAEIVKRGAELKAPFELSWSCYRDNNIACGTCDSCHLRLKAFKKAGIPDPIPYREG